MIRANRFARIALRIARATKFMQRKHLPSTPTFLQYKKKILRGTNFVKITKIFSSVDPESGHSCLVFVQYPRDSPRTARSAWELQKKSVPQRIPVKITKNYPKKPGGELICKKFGVNGSAFVLAVFAMMFQVLFG